jgi:hypothetical protein
MRQIDAQLLRRELSRFTSDDLLNLGIGQAIVRMGSARDTFNMKVPLGQRGNSQRADLVRGSNRVGQAIHKLASCRFSLPQFGQFIADPRFTCEDERSL